LPSTVESQFSFWRFGYELFLLGRFDEAKARATKGSEIESQLSPCTSLAARFSSRRDTQLESLVEMEQETENGERRKLSGESMAYYALQRREELGPRPE